MNSLQLFLLFSLVFCETMQSMDTPEQTRVARLQQLLEYKDPGYKEGLKLLNGAAPEEGQTMVTLLQAHAQKHAGNEHLRESVRNYIGEIYTLAMWTEEVTTAQSAVESMMLTLPLLHRLDTSGAYKLANHVAEWIKEEMLKLFLNYPRAAVDTPLRFFAWLRSFDQELFKQQADDMLKNRLSSLLAYIPHHQDNMQAFAGTQLAPESILQTVFNRLFEERRNVSGNLDEAINRFFLMVDHDTRVRFQEQLQAALPLLKHPIKRNLLTDLLKSPSSTLRTAAFKECARELCSDHYYLNELLDHSFDGVYNDQPAEYAFAYLIDTLGAASAWLGLQKLCAQLQEPNVQATRGLDKATAHTILRKIIAYFFGSEAAKRFSPDMNVEVFILAELHRVITHATFSVGVCDFIHMTDKSCLLSSCQHEVDAVKRKVVFCNDAPLGYRCLFLCDLLEHAIRQGSTDPVVNAIRDLEPLPFKEYAEMLLKLMSPNLSANEVLTYRNALRHLAEHNGSLIASPEMLKLLWGDHYPCAFLSGEQLLDEHGDPMPSYVHVYLRDAQKVGPFLIGYRVDHHRTAGKGLRLTVCSADDGCPVWEAPLLLVAGTHGRSRYAARNKRLYSVDEQGVLAMLNLENGAIKQFASIPSLASCSCMGFVRDDLLIAASQKSWCLVDVNSNIVVRTGTLPEYTGFDIELFGGYLVYQVGSRDENSDLSFRLELLDVLHENQQPYVLRLGFIPPLTKKVWWAMDTVWYYQKHQEAGKFSYELVAVCPKSGEVVRRRSLPAAVCCKPEVTKAGTIMYVGTDKELIAFSLNGMTESEEELPIIWSIPLAYESLTIDQLMLSPDERTLYATGLGKPLMMIDTTRGDYRVSQKEFSEQQPLVAADDGIIYFKR